LRKSAVLGHIRDLAVVINAVKVVTMDSAIHGTVAPGFEGVRAAFEENFRRHGDKGAAVGV
jgi:hypothetical protein